MIDLTSIDGAVFDADGTLYDSMWMWHQAEKEYIASHGVPWRPDIVEKLRTLGFFGIAEYLRTEFGVNKTVEEITSGIDALMEDFYSQKVMLKPGVLTVLNSFRERGIKMCIATATDKYLTEAALQRTGVREYFGKVFNCGDEKTDKKHPDIFIRAAAFLGTDISRTIVIEDALHAARTAKSAGFRVVGVYERTAEIYQDEMRAVCDMFVMSIDEIL